jgi:hypothetical protein
MIAGTYDIAENLVQPVADATVGLMALSKSLSSVTATASNITATTDTIVPKEPESLLPKAFSDFLTDTLAGGSLFTVPAKKTSEEGEGEATEKVKSLAADVAGEQVSNDEKQKESDKKMWASKLTNAISGSKKLAKVAKAYAISAAIINTAAGITETFKQHGFPAAIPFAVALAAQGAAQVATIKGQAHDGLDKIPSTGTYMLEKGERVVGRRLNQDLSGFLQSAGDTSISNSVDRTSNRSSTFNPTINMSFGAGADANSLASNRGAVETMIREIYADYALESPFGA